MLHSELSELALQSSEKQLSAQAILLPFSRLLSSMRVHLSSESLSSIVSLLLLYGICAFGEFFLLLLFFAKRLRTFPRAAKDRLLD